MNTKFEFEELSEEALLQVAGGHEDTVGLPGSSPPAAAPTPKKPKPNKKPHKRPRGHGHHH